MIEREPIPRAVRADRHEIKFLVSIDMACAPSDVSRTSHEVRRSSEWSNHFNPAPGEEIPEVQLVMLGGLRVGYALPDRSVDPPVITEMAINPRHARNPQVVDALLQACGVDAGLLSRQPSMPVPTSV